MSARLRVLAALPTPPPYSGPEVVADLLLRTGFGPDIEVSHVRTNVHARNAGKGHVSAHSLLSLARVWLQLVGVIVTRRPSLLFLYLAQNTTGFVRDALLVLTARLAGLRVVVQVHGANFDNFRKDAPFLLSKLIEFVLHQISDVVVLADRFRPQFAGLLPAERCRVISNPVDVVAGPTRGLRHPPCTILFMGHLSRAKGFADVIECAPRVLEAVPGVRFEFAGEWLPDEQNIHRDEAGRPLERAADLGVRVADLMSRYADRVQLLGVITGDAKAAAFRRAHIFVLPSYSEGLPAAVMEAMAAGLPVVVTPVGALPQILVDKTHAVFVAPGDVTGLGTALIELGRDADRCARMGETNRAYVQERFSPSRIAADFASCFRNEGREGSFACTN